jgi:hypothetical protein
MIQIIRKVTLSLAPRLSLEAPVHPQFESFPKVKQNGVRNWVSIQKDSQQDCVFDRWVFT